MTMLNRWYKINCAIDPDQSMFAIEMQEFKDGSSMLIHTVRENAWSLGFRKRYEVLSYEQTIVFKATHAETLDYPEMCI